MNKRYRLKKDFPGLKAGEIFVYDGDAWYDSENKDIYNEINHYAPKCVHNNSEWFEEIHQPKEDKPEWEIVAFDNEHGGETRYTIHDNSYWTQQKWQESLLSRNRAIHSVKRSDGEVFSVGDKIKIYYHPNYSPLQGVRTIESFELKSGIIIHHESGDSKLSDIQKYYPKSKKESKEVRPKIVCLCGSTRFMGEFQQANLKLTMEGIIVLSVGCNTKSGSDLFGEMPEGQLAELKNRLDELHKRKIDLADEILVLNVGGYIGESTRSEIEYAEKLNKPIKYLEPTILDKPKSKEELKEPERIEVYMVKWSGDSFVSQGHNKPPYQVHEVLATHRIPKEKLKDVAQAIEQVLNDEPKEKPVLFQTEDGVNVTDGERMIWYVSNHKLRERKAKNLVHLSNKKFFLMEKAVEYIMMNKPSMSASEILCLSAKYGISVVPLEKEIEELAKSKSLK